jgi:nicotinate-nucleotide adenylyltransferase
MRVEMSTTESLSGRRVALYGGTFNPIHHGHLRVALECYEAIAADAVWFIPNATPPHRDQPITANEDRQKMVELAIASYPQFQLNTIELDQPDISYTVNTVSQLKQSYPETEFFWIIGQDSFNKFDSWHQWQNLLAMVNWLVVPRPNYAATYSDALQDYVMANTVVLKKTQNSLGCGKIFNIDTTPLAISSTEIRGLASQNKACDFLVTPAVSCYISEHKLYQS